MMPILAIAFAMLNHSQGWPIANFNPVGFPPDSSRSCARNPNNPVGCGKSAMGGRGDAIFTDGYSSRHGNRCIDLGTRQYATMTWLRALGEFQPDHLDLIGGGTFSKALGAEAAVRIATVACRAGS